MDTQAQKIATQCIDHLIIEELSIEESVNKAGAFGEQYLIDKLISYSPNRTLDEKKAQKILAELTPNILREVPLHGHMPLSSQKAEQKWYELVRIEQYQ